MARTAADMNFDILGFSSHAPLPFETVWNLPAQRLEEYKQGVRSLASDWKPQGLTILLGLEIDWIEGFSSALDPQYQDLDYSIGSMHFVAPSGGFGFAVDEPAEDFLVHLSQQAGGDIRRVVELYYGNLGRMVGAGGFDILGHFDLVRKNNTGGILFDEESTWYRNAALEAVEALAGKEIIVEINCGGMTRGKTLTPYPSLFILKEMKRLGIRITFCDDAHHPSHLGAYREAALELAHTAGYRSIARLENGIWIEEGFDGMLVD